MKSISTVFLVMIVLSIFLFSTASAQNFDYVPPGTTEQELQTGPQYAPYLPPGMTEQEIHTGQKSTNIDVSCSQYKYPWCKKTDAQDPAGLVKNFYVIALGLAAAAAMGVLIYGGILWTMSGAVTSKQDAMQWIWGAIWGLVLLLGAYIILYTINPNLVNLKNPDGLFKKIDFQDLNKPISVNSEIPTDKPIMKPETGNVYEVLNNDQTLDKSFVRSEFFSAGISWGGKSECTAGQTTNCISFQGLRGGTYNEMIELKNDVAKNGFTFTITGGTEAGHAPGEISHASGYKVDLRASNDQSDGLSQYMLKNFTKSATESNTYINPKTGAKYVFESQLKDSSGKITRYSHWDVAVK